MNYKKEQLPEDFNYVEWVNNLHVFHVDFMVQCGMYGAILDQKTFAERIANIVKGEIVS